ncbi:MAG TPA: SDR family NAD(P)-dependent oxidoreductase [Galbitalea sp.]|jgi:NAD(P)-dependent dehydrogenase (short-subunit alcohol dehydrogenase family)
MTTPTFSIPFGATTTAAEVVRGVDLHGKRAIVTGASSGIGVETARALASAGADVTLAVRSVAAGQRAAADIESTTHRMPRVAQVDMVDRASIARFAGDWSGPLHILVNNAGIMALPELTRSPEGWELQFATNHLGHFALANALHAWLVEAAGARIVSVSSVGHIDGAVDFDDIQFERRAYNQWVAYGQSKTANILFAVEGARRWAGEGITSNALNPGWIPATGLSRHLATKGAALPAAAPGVANSTGVSVKSVEQGASTSVLLAASPLIDGVTGRYFEDAQLAAPLVPGIRRGVADFAVDPANAERLWEVSTALLAR